MNDVHEIKPDRKQFLVHKLLIQRAFNNSAFRKGTSLFRLGLVPSNVSDHLPIDIKIKINEQVHNVLCWNMLSDDHLFNNFMNITGLDIVFEQMSQVLKEQGHANIYVKSKMQYHFFAELAQFIYNKRNVDRKTITINEALLDEFCSLPSQGSRVLRPDATPEQRQQIELARRAFLTAYTTQNKVLSHEVRQSITHSLEMIYQIKDGALPWPKRLQYLRDNKQLVAQLLDKKILMFQELTKPEDMLDLFREAGNPGMQMLQHKSNPREPSQDNCALIFDTRRYELIGSPVTGDVHRKPYIFAILKDRETGKSFIASSIHHPGGESDHRQTYLDVICRIRREQGDLLLPYMISGDYNHTEHQFRQMISPGECGLIRLETDPELSDTELERQLENKPCYAIFESKIYYISYEGKHLNKTVLHTVNVEKTEAIFPLVPNVRIVASKEKLTQIESLTGHISVASIEMSYPDKGSMAGNDYNNINKAIDAVVSGVGADNITVQTSTHVLTSSHEDTMPYSVQFCLEGKLEPHAGRLKQIILPEDRTDSESDDLLDLNTVERTEPVTLTFS